MSVNLQTFLVGKIHACNRDPVLRVEHEALDSPEDEEVWTMMPHDATVASLCSVIPMHRVLAVCRVAVMAL